MNLYLPPLKCWKNLSSFAENSISIFWARGAYQVFTSCAASVLLTQLYVEGALRFSSLVAGLCTGAGVGLAVLWRANPSWKQNLFITGLTWAAGAFVGVAMQVVVAVFA